MELIFKKIINFVREHSEDLNIVLFDDLIKLCSIRLADEFVILSAKEINYAENFQY